MRAWPSVCLIMRCLSEAVKHLWEDMSAVCTTCIYIGAAFLFYLFILKYNTMVTGSTPSHTDMQGKAKKTHFSCVSKVKEEHAHG